MVNTKNYINKRSRLNNFILWCKGWYISTSNNDMFDDVTKILTLDDYVFIRNKQDVLTILLNYLDELISDGIVSNISLLRWESEMQKYLLLTNRDYEKSLLLIIRDFFAFSVTSDEIKLYPPSYSRKLYKIGFIAPKHFGNSYKLANYKASKILKK